MPKLSSLIEVGVSGNLAPVQPLVGPMLWTSLATGKRADKHGICSLLEPLPGNAGYRPVTRTSRQCQTIWNILSAAEMKSHIIGWPVTSPAEPINGTIISDQFLLQQDHCRLHEQDIVERNLCYPQALADDLFPLLVNRRDLAAETLAKSDFGPASQDASQDKDSLAIFVAAASTIHAVACRQLSQEPWDFAAVWYPTFDCKSAWKFQDDMLSSLVDLAGEETTVILVSPQAATDMTVAQGDPNTASHRFGIACLAGSGVDHGKVLRGATILDIVPTVLSMFDLPIGADMDGRPWREAISEQASPRQTPTWELIEGSAEPVVKNQSESLLDAFPSESVEPDSATTEMLKLIRRNQKINLALALSDSNRAALAVNFWNELMADFPEDPYFPLQLISSLINTRDYIECRKVIAQLTPEMAEHPQVRLALAEVEFNDGHIDKARCIVRDIVDKDLALSEWLNRAGNILLKCNAWKEAAQVFLKSLQAQTNNPSARHGLSTAYWEQDQFEDAIRESRQVLATVPSFSQARFTLAKSLQGIGKLEEAIDAFEICLNEGYQPQETHGRLAALYRIRDPIRASYHQLQSEVC